MTFLPEPAPGVGVPAGVLAALASAVLGNVAGAEETVEAYVAEPMPEGVQVIATELDGPVFATTDGMTIYEWPRHKLRNGYSGEDPGRPECYDEVSTVTAGLMSPYPAGIELPELESRPSCTDLWPPLYADENAKSVGNWSIVDRRDDTRQWAYDEQPLYTSARDELPGDTIGGWTRRYGGDSPARRVPLKPRPLLPPGFGVRSVSLGRMLTTASNESVYAHEADTATETRCYDDCLRSFSPVIAPALARPRGEWSLLERSPGLRQWVYRGKPLYTHVNDQHSWSQQGSDLPGWDNVFTQTAPPFPDAFTVQESLSGLVLADQNGRTIYRYRCGDDSVDQLSCEHPDDSQVYRLAACGGSQERCMQHWPYVLAPEDATQSNRSWRVVSIDPATGRFAAPEQANALKVWAYRDRPVYTYYADEAPGDVHGDGTGEWRGQRNGLAAFWLRDDFLGRTL